MTKKERAFVESVYGHYRKHGRHDLPWRKTRDPYCIAVSELMLQQTQVSRVVGKYGEFLTAFPTVDALAWAPLHAVLRIWSGLGYNRRAKFLHSMARAVVDGHGGKFPTTVQGLRTLPGIGPYTAHAIMAFAYDMPGTMIETNIRTAYLHHFFTETAAVSDTELAVVIQQTLDADNPRKWYWALMDYGAHLKQAGSTVHRASAHYAKQSAFAGSRRQVRGIIMRALVEGGTTARQLVSKTGRERAVVLSVLADLADEGFVERVKGAYCLKG